MQWWWYTSKHTRKKAVLLQFAINHQNMKISQPFHDSQLCCCQSKQIIPTLVKTGFCTLLQVASTHPSMKYRKIIWFHAKEEIICYPYIGLSMKVFRIFFVVGNSHLGRLFQVVNFLRCTVVPIISLAKQVPIRIQEKLDGPAFGNMFYFFLLCGSQ